MGNIQNFRDLTVWQKAHQLVLMIYKLTKKLPESELFSLVSQMRRCAVSVTSNIVEGFARQGAKEKVQFYFHAKSSLVELQSQLEIAKDLKYIASVDYLRIESLAVEVQKMISGLIKSIKG